MKKDADTRSSPVLPKLLKELSNPKLAAAYIEVALEDEDPKFLMVAISDVVEANGGVTALAKATKLNRTTLYKTLSGKISPQISTIRTILDALGIKMSFKGATKKAPMVAAG
jgi:probable addiction module antidote protein